MAKTGNHGFIIPRDRELLYGLYWEQEMTLPEIGKLFGVNHKSVLYALRSLDIPTRGRGYARYTRCFVSGCQQPVHRIHHKANGAWYGRRCLEHWKVYRKQVCAASGRKSRQERPEHFKRQFREWYYNGPKSIEGDRQWLQQSRRLLRLVKRKLWKRKNNLEVYLYRKVGSGPERTSQTS